MANVKLRVTDPPGTHRPIASPLASGRKSDYSTSALSDSPLGRRPGRHARVQAKEGRMAEELPESKLGKLTRLMWLVSGIVTAILVIVIMIIIMMRGTGY
jgi:beta-lactamase regulating signal transducer with metallopeptidase domain